MRKILSLLLALTVAVGAWAGDDSLRDQHHAKQQEARQALFERERQQAVAQQAQPRNQLPREQQAQPRYQLPKESQAQPESKVLPEFKHPQQPAAERPKAVIPAKRQAKSQATPQQGKLPPEKPKREPQVSTSAQAKAPAIDEKHLENDAPKARISKRAPNRTPELITVQPMGALVRYTHTYRNYDLYSQGANGTATMQTWIVYAPDGETVYLKDLFYNGGNSDCWVRGTINGNTITVPLGQYIYYSNYYNYGYYLAWGTTVIDENNLVTFVEDPNVTQITYTIDGDNITLDNSSAGNNGVGAAGLAVIADDDGFVPYIQWGSVFNNGTALLNPSGQTVIKAQPTGELVQYSQALDIYDTDYNQSYSATTGTSVVFDPDGETVYFKNLYYWDYLFNSENSWVKGTISGNKLTVPLPQYTWIYSSSSYNDDCSGLVWGHTIKKNGQNTFVWDPTVTEMTFTIDSEGVLTLDNGSPGINGEGVTGFGIMSSNDGFSYPQYASVLTPPYQAPEVITDQPVGEMRDYKHSTDGLINTDDGLKLFADNNEAASIVYAPDGETVYFYNPVSTVSGNCWVKGTISGSKITVPIMQIHNLKEIRQYVYYNEQESTGGYLAWGTSVKNPDGSYTVTPDNDVTQVTYTIDGDIITLDNTNGGVDGDAAAGLFVMDEGGDEPVGMNWRSVYTPIPEPIYEQPDGEPVMYDNHVECLIYRNGDVEPISDTGKTDIVYDPDDETVYFHNWFTDSWIRGTINGNKIIVPMGQYVFYDMNAFMGYHLVWGTSAKQPDGSYTFTPDPTVTQATYTIDGDNITLDNANGNVDGATGWAVVCDGDNGAKFFYIVWTDQYTRFVVPTVITEQPAGRLKTYDRYSNIITFDEEEPWEFGSKINIVFAPDGETVYFQDLVATNDGTWMRGTIAGDKIHVPLGQYTYYNETNYEGLGLAWGTATRTPEGGNGSFSFTPDLNATEVTFTLDGDYIIMDNSSAGNNGDGAVGLALVWDNGNPFFIMEYNTLFLPPVDKEYISYQPDGLLSLYERSGRWVDYNSEEKQQAGVVPVIYDTDGETVYMASQLGWMKGSVKDDKLSFPTRQCLYYDYNNDDGNMLVWGTYQWYEEYGRYYFDYDPTVTEVTFTVAGDRIIMDNSTESPDGKIRTGMALMSINSYGIYAFEWNSVFTYFEEPRVIYDQPEGDVAYYDQAIEGTYLYSPWAIDGTYTTQMVYAPNSNTVYILNPLPFLDDWSWVKGTIDGNKIHVPLGQYLAYEEDTYWGKYLAFGTAVMNDEGHLVLVQDPNVTEVTYTIHDNGTITLDNTSAGDDSHNGAMGLIAMHNDGVDGNQMIWTSQYTSTDVPTVTDLMPEGILMVYNRSGRAVNQLGNVVDQGSTLKMVYDPDGETVYMQNIAYGRRDDTWVRGTKSGGKIHVPLGQYVTYNFSRKSGCMIAAGWETMVDGTLRFTPAAGDITEITYTIHDDGTLSLDNTYGGPNDDGVDGFGLCYVMNVNTRGYGMEWNTVLTPSTEPVLMTDQPQGTLKRYFRVNYPNHDSYYTYDDYYNYSVIDIVYSNTSNAVYIKNPVGTGDNYGTWVKGTIIGDRVISIPTGQYLYYDRDYNYYRKLYWVKKVKRTHIVEGVLQEYDSFEPDYDMASVNYTINGDTITMNDYYPSENNLGLGACSFSLSGELEGVSWWDLTAKYIPYFEPKVIKKRPAGSLVTYNRRGNALGHGDELRKRGHASVTADHLLPQGDKTYVVYAPDGRTVYLFEPVQCRSNTHEPRYTWVMGTLSEDGHKIIVPLDQYVGWDPETNYAERLAWGTSHLRKNSYNEYETYFEPDNSVMTVTYTIEDGRIRMDNSSGHIYSSSSWDHDPSYWGEDNTGLAITDQFMQWRGELNWSTTYAGDHPAVPMDPVVEEWYDSQNESGNSSLMTTFELTDVDGYGLEESGYSYSIYTDKGELFTFEASKYDLPEDATVITYDMWKDNWKLRPWCIYFYRTNAEGYEPFFDWRIGIQLHYTCDDVMQSSNIVYLDVFDAPVGPETPGDVDGDGEVGVADVATLIDMILCGDITELGDVDGDGVVSVADVALLIDMILTN